MELYVAANDVPDAARLFVWWWLCLIYASLRFDDGIHVSPKELSFTDDGLFGVSWQTKVERKRRGTKFVVPIVSLSGVEWLAIGWDLFDAPSLDRDFWMPDLNSREEFRNQPPEHARSVQWLNALKGGSRAFCAGAKLPRRQSAGVGRQDREVHCSFGQSHNA